MSVTGIAALIAAVSFAIIAVAIAYLAIRATRVLAPNVGRVILFLRG